ncbi:hypothetical protein [Paenarthrobacter nitroguajacolicus]|nr:hypothetical protein [Paenarthrobacter nitroguajacolicus]MDR6639733.1 hypothetical protein [Paenarthrobacter nitroguajacolicus]
MSEDDKPSPRFLTIEQVAEELATSEVQIRAMLKDKDAKTPRKPRGPLS